MTQCRECRRARTPNAFGLCHTCYTRMRRAAIEAGTWESVMVPVDRVRGHVDRLHDEGYSYALIARLAGVNVTTVEDIGSGQSTQVMLDIEERVCGVRGGLLWELWKTLDYEHRLPSEPLVRRLRALSADGWTYSEIADALGWARSLVGRYLNTPPATVTSRTMRRVDAVYRSDQFQTPVRRAPKTIAAKGWPRPLDWDEIDDPDNEISARRRAAHRLRTKELC